MESKLQKNYCTVAVALSFDKNAIRYVLLLLWMTSCFYVLGHIQHMFVIAYLRLLEVYMFIMLAITITVVTSLETWVQSSGVGKENWGRWHILSCFVAVEYEQQMLYVVV